MARLLRIFTLLLGPLMFGCQHRLAWVSCDSPCPAACPPTETTTAAPAVEVKGPDTIHVKAPAPKVEVTLPPPSRPAGEGCASGPCITINTPYGPQTFPAAAPGAPAAAPPQPPVAYAPQAPVAYSPQAPVAYAPMAPAYGPAMTSSTQTVRPHTRIALGFDTIRIPLPCLKFFALPGEQEVVTRQTFQAPAMSYAPAPAMAPMMPVAAAPAPVMYAPQPQAYAPAPAMAPVMPVAAAPAPAMAPMMPVAAAPAPVMYAPVQAPQPVYAPQSTTIQGTICVPVPRCAPACETPATPAPCAPGCHQVGANMLEHLNQMQKRVDAFESNYRNQIGLTGMILPAGGTLPPR
jgi:hypothetical protein